MNKIVFSKICILAIFASTSYALDVDKHLELSYVQTSGNSNTSTFSTKVEASTLVEIQIQALFLQKLKHQQP